MRKKTALCRAILFLLFTTTFLLSIKAQTSDSKNYAICLDGKDNNLRIGMDTIKEVWTIEAWIKGNNPNWKETEVIIGGSEYSDLNIIDNLPLILKNGKLHNTAANLSAETTLDTNWHHVAATCNGKTTTLYLDGRKAASKDIASSILPGAIGIHETAESAFGGLIDEVRIWKTALPASTISQWMNKPLTPRHPAFKTLKGYYTFDETGNEMFVNWAARGHLSFHARNGRVSYYGKEPLAHTVINDNPMFENPLQKQELFNAVTVLSEWDTDQGTKDDQILKLRIAVQGSDKPLRLTELLLNLNQTTNLEDIEKVHVYYTGAKPKSEIKTELFGTGTKPAVRMKFKSSATDAQTLQPGINYFLITFDVKENALAGNRLQAAVSSFKLDKKTYIPEQDPDYYPKIITNNSKTNNIVKVLQWNIWHGGVHVGEDGRKHIIDLIKSTNADIITMQEGYGAQERIAAALNYSLQTKSANDNLALLSRYPITKIDTKNSFKSNPAKITLPNGRKIIVNDCWLRYAYRPEYTCVYPNRGLDPKQWVAEDTLYPLEDIKEIIRNDLIPYQESADMPVIFGGDFNSCSHLDWTEAAAPLHFGYGPVNFPTSKFMIENGYKDSFREINPNEVTHQGGTFAVILGLLQTSRIDFLYYKGAKIKALSSKIIRSAEEIDFIWASDHAAVLTVFEILP